MLEEHSSPEHVAFCIHQGPREVVIAATKLGSQVHSLVGQSCQGEVSLTLNVQTHPVCSANSPKGQFYPISLTKNPISKIVIYFINIQEEFKYLFHSSTYDVSRLLRE